MKFCGLPVAVSVAGRRFSRRARGFTLLEVLVSIVVLSFGVLGVVGLQAAALQANKDARYQSSAARLARELGDMMRDNPTIALKTTGNPYLVSLFTGSVPTIAQNCYTSPCVGNPTALAQFQMADWLERVKEELPGAQVTVCFDATPYQGNGQAQWPCSGAGQLVYIKIGWTRQGFNANQAAASAVNLANSTGPSIVQAVLPG